LNRTTLEGRIRNNSWTIYPYDNRKALQQLKDNSVDCILTSPPYLNSRAYGELGREEGNQAKYNMPRSGNPMINEIGFGQSFEDYFNSLEEVFKQCFRVLKNNKWFFVNVNKIRDNLTTFDISHEVVRRVTLQGFSHRDTIIWIKNNPRPLLPTSKPYYLDDGWEYILMFSKGKAIINRENYLPMSLDFKCVSCKTVNKLVKKSRPNYFHTNIGFTENRLSSDHPAKFPLALPNFIFSLCTKQGDLILDPFAGVGTSLVAGLYNNLNVIGCEINLDFCNSAIREINALSK
jgi:modification methylase